MMRNRQVVSILRKDAVFVWNAVISVVFIGFATLAIAAALFDFISLRH